MLPCTSPLSAVAPDAQAHASEYVPGQVGTPSKVYPSEQVLVLDSSNDVIGAFSQLEMRPVNSSVAESNRVKHVTFGRLNQRHL